MNTAPFFLIKFCKGKKVLIIYSEKYSDFSSMMARYEEEMRRAYASAPHLEGTGVPAAAQEDNALEEKLARQDAAVQQAAELVLESLPTEENTTPDKTPDKTEIHPSEDYAYAMDGVQGLNPENDLGKIIVTATSGRDAYPIAGVNVIIDRADTNDGGGRQELVGILVTNSSGRTEPLTVETVNRDLSREPDEKGDTFTTYYISARKAGYFPIDRYPVDVFGGQTSILELSFTPEPEYLGGGGN